MSVTAHDRLPVTESQRLKSAQGLPRLKLVLILIHGLLSTTGSPDVMSSMLLCVETRAQAQTPVHASVAVAQLH